MILKEQNILFLSRTMGLGGTENVIIQICEILKPKANKLIVCTCGGVNVSKLKAMGIRHYEIPDIAKKNPITMIKIWKKIKKIVRDEKITVIHSHHRMAAFYGQFIHQANIIKIASAHNTFYNNKILTKLAYRNTRLIAVGEMVKKNLINYFGFSEQQVTVIHNAVKPFCDTVRPIDCIEKARNDGCTIIGNIGRLSEQKGMRYFIEAAEMVHKTHLSTRFFIIGDGEEKATLQALVNQKHLEDVVLFLGYRSDIQNCMSQMDFIVLSSLWEGFPLTPIEAFSVGRTIIATAVDGTPEIVRDDINGCLIQAKNSKLLAEKIVYLLEHPEKKKELELQAKKCYDAKFSFEKLKWKYIEYYERL